jgi:hypothetical protein
MVSVGIDSLDPEQAKVGSISYAVTASHVVNHVGNSQEIYMRINGNESSFDIPLPKASWIHHHETDVAVCPIDWPQDRNEYRALAFPITLLLDDAQAKQDPVKDGVSEGDEVIMIGLFPTFAGTKRIQPLARFGRLALMPYEKLTITTDSIKKRTAQVYAYLVESLAWKAMSGCPAIVYPTRSLGMRGTEMMMPFRVLGLVHGAVEYEDKVRFKREEKELRFHSGITVVVLASAIYEVLMQEDLRAQRECILKQAIEEQKNTPIATPTMQ